MKCVYKIVCRDTNITEFYIGSSMDFNSRKTNHKSNSINLNNKDYCLPLYMFINVNGGFENWEIVVIKEYKFITAKELNMNEQYYIELLKPNLNSNNAYGYDIDRKKNTQKDYELVNDNCPQCGKEMRKKNINKHIKLYCKENKPQPNNCGYEYPGWEWDEGIPWK